MNYETYQPNAEAGLEAEPYIGMPLPGLSTDSLTAAFQAEMTAVEVAGPTEQPRAAYAMERVCEQAATSCDSRPIDILPIAMAYVPWQMWSEVYEPEQGFAQGTIFPELDLPFLGYRGATR